MKKSKRFLSFLLAICLLVVCLPLSASAAGITSGKCGDNVTWNFDRSTGTLTISGKGKMNDYDTGSFVGDILAPWNDFYEDIKTAIIQPGVTSIGSCAFFGYNNHLTSVSIGNSVTNIGAAAFEGCAGLTSIKIPNSVRIIENEAFGSCEKLTSIDLPNGVTEIWHFAFSGCTSLTSVTIPASVTELSYQVFGDCPNLKEIKVNPNNPNFYSENGVLYERNVTIWEENKTTTELRKCPTSKTGTFTIPNHIGTISDDAFEGCTGLTSVTIPSSITELPDSVFRGCTSLTSIVIPNSVTDIGLAWGNVSGTFEDCTSLTAITIPASVTCISKIAFAGCPNLTIYGTAGSYAEKYAKEHNIPFVAGKAPDKPSKPTVAGFKDVFEGQYYAEPVKWAVENQITGGTDKTHFSPNASCTRAQAVTFLWNAANRPEPQGNTSRFTDVKSGSYYEKAVQWAVENQITGGTDSNHFSPDSTCTRAQIVTFLYHAASSPVISGNNSFSDVKSGSYYENAVKWAVENGITSGTGSGKFSPGDNCVRAQIVTFLYNYHN